MVREETSEGTVTLRPAFFLRNFIRWIPRGAPPWMRGQMKGNPALLCRHRASKRAWRKRMRSGVAGSEEEGRSFVAHPQTMDIGGGDLPKQQTVLDVSRIERFGACERSGGLHGILPWLYPTIHDVFHSTWRSWFRPAATPQALRHCWRRSCIEPHAVRTDLERLVWDKPRACSEPAKRRTSPWPRKWVRHLVRRMCALNQDLVLARSRGSSPGVHRAGKGWLPGHQLAVHPRLL